MGELGNLIGILIGIPMLYCYWKTCRWVPKYVRVFVRGTKSLGQDKESEDRRTKDYCFLALCSPLKHVTLPPLCYYVSIQVWLAWRSRTVHNFTFSCNTNMIIHIAKQFFSRILGWVQWFCFECHTNSDKRIFIAQFRSDHSLFTDLFKDLASIH